MPRITIDPQDERATYAPGTSVTFQISGDDGLALLPRLRLCGRVALTGSSAAGTIYLPSIGAHACISKIDVISTTKGSLLNLMDYNRYMAVAKAATRPEDRFSAADDLSGPSLSIMRGEMSQASGGTGIATPFTLELEQLNGGLLSQPLPFSQFGVLRVTISLATAQQGVVQDSAQTDGAFQLSELSLAYDVAPVAAALAKQAATVNFIRPEVQRINMDTGRVSLTIPGTETLIAAAVVFMQADAENSVAASASRLQAPPGLERVSFQLNSSALAEYDITIGDPYAAQVQTDFFAALMAAGFPVDAADSVVSRASSEALRWRYANTSANNASSLLPIGGVGVEDAYGLGAVFPPSGQSGQLSVKLEWNAAATYIAHLILFFAASV